MQSASREATASGTKLYYSKQALLTGLLPATTQPSARVKPVDLASSKASPTLVESCAQMLVKLLTTILAIVGYVTTALPHQAVAQPASTNETACAQNNAVIVTKNISDTQVVEIREIEAVEDLISYFMAAATDSQREAL